jgi:ABC-type multidrug transport system fused ATPase/permease subunit
MQGRTTLIVTHRLATVHGLDRIVVLEHGRVVEDGTGPDLLERGGLYAKMFRAGQHSS